MAKLNHETIRANNDLRIRARFHRNHRREVIKINDAYAHTLLCFETPATTFSKMCSPSLFAPLPPLCQVSSN